MATKRSSPKNVSKSAEVVQALTDMIRRGVIRDDMPPRQMRAMNSELKAGTFRAILSRLRKGADEGMMCSSFAFCVAGGICSN